MGVAGELTARGAATHAVQLAGGWKDASMVVRYAASVATRLGATAETRRRDRAGPTAPSCVRPSNLEAESKWARQGGELMSPEDRRMAEGPQRVAIAEGKWADTRTNC